MNGSHNCFYKMLSMTIFNLHHCSDFYLEYTFSFLLKSPTALFQPHSQVMTLFPTSWRKWKQQEENSICSPCHFLPSTSICICILLVCTWMYYLCSCLKLSSPMPSYVVKNSTPAILSSFSYIIFHISLDLFFSAFTSMLSYIVS